MRQQESWRIVSVVIAGVFLGLSNSWSSAFGSPYGAQALSPGQGVLVLEYTAALLGTPWAWATFAFAVGWWSTRRTTAMFSATAGLLAAVTVYYVSDKALGVDDSFNSAEMVTWWIISVPVGAVFAMLGSSRFNRPISIVPGLTLPILVVVSTLFYRVGSQAIFSGVRQVSFAIAALLVVFFVARALRIRAPQGTEPSR